MTVERMSVSKLLATLGLILALGLGLSACGGKKSMEGAGEDEQSGTISTDQPTTLAGEEEGVAQASFDEAEQARRQAALPKGSTASGAGKKREVTVRAGDTLWKIAERKDVYGSGWLYPVLYKANKDRIKDPNHLEEGLKLTVPRNLSKVEEEIAKEEAMTGQILDTSPIGGTQPKQAELPKKVKKPRKGGRGWVWFLVLVVGGVGFYQWRRMKKAAADDGTTAPA